MVENAHFQGKKRENLHILQELPKSPVALQCIVGLTFGMKLWILRHEFVLDCLNRILVIWPEMGLLGPKRAQKESNLISHLPLVVESRLPIKMTTRPELWGVLSY